MADREREAFEAAERLVREAQERAEQAANEAAREVPPNGWASAANSTSGCCPRMRSPACWSNGTRCSGPSCSICHRWASHPFTYWAITSGSLAVHRVRTDAPSQRAVRPSIACRGHT